MRRTLSDRTAGPRKVLKFERLEDRMLLTGNVQCACTNGHMVICGDKCNNSICVRQIDECRWEVKGECGTTVNGKECCIIKDVKCISIDCKCGNDSVRISGGSLCGCISVCDTQGNNCCAIREVTAGGFNIKTGSGSDCCAIVCCRVCCEPSCNGKTAVNGVKYNSCCIDTGCGNDNVALSKLCGECCKVQVNCGDGVDKCCISRCEVKQICCDSGRGCDEVAISNCKTQSCEVKCDKTDKLAYTGNSCQPTKCSAPCQDDIASCLKDICDSRDWQQTVCNLIAKIADLI